MIAIAAESATIQAPLGLTQRAFRVVRSSSLADRDAVGGAVHSIMSGDCWRHRSPIGSPMCAGLQAHSRCTHRRTWRDYRANDCVVLRDGVTVARVYQHELGPINRAPHTGSIPSISDQAPKMPPIRGFSMLIAWAAESYFGWRDREGDVQSDSENSGSLVISYLTLRRTLGVLGLALPFVLYLGGRILFGTDLQVSISDYYHTYMRDVFVGIIIAIGFFLFSYTGYESGAHITDNRVANVAGGSAIGLALFRTAPEIGVVDPVGVAHLIFSALFFLSLSYFSYFLFTKTKPDTPPTPQKLKRNKIYRACGVTMATAIILIAAMKWFLPSETQQSLAAYEPVFWLESLAVVAFGISWLIKGETLLRDEADHTTVA